MSDHKIPFSRRQFLATTALGAAASSSPAAAVDSPGIRASANGTTKMRFHQDKINWAFIPHLRAHAFANLTRRRLPYTHDLNNLPTETRVGTMKSGVETSYKAITRLARRVWE